MHSRVSVITVFHQGRHVARDYVRAWERAQTAGGAPPELLFGDNASTDGTRGLLRNTNLAGMRLVEFAENLGFARANNRLAALATGEILLFLNFDVAFCRSWLDHLVQAFDGRPRLGIVGNVQLSVRSREVDHAGIFFDASGTPYHFRPRLENLAPLDLLPVPAVTGACLAVRRDLFESIGGFHEGYLNSYEDTELCVRARERGAEVAVATRSRIWHYISTSPGRGDREEANARLFRARCGEQARSLARFTPPELPTPRPGLAVEPISPATDTLQVYFDRGSGFAEEGSAVHLFELGRWNRIEIPLPVDASVAALTLRLDPGRNPGQMRLGGLSLKSAPSRATLSRLDSDRFRRCAAVQGTARIDERKTGFGVVSTGDDPQVVIPLRHLATTAPRGSVLDLWLFAEAPPSTSPPRSAAPRPRGFFQRWRRKRIAVDLTRLSPGGVNGGVKVLVFELLEAIARRHALRLSVTVLATEAVCREIRERRSRLRTESVDTSDSQSEPHALADADLLYAPLGYSRFSRPDVPQVSLMVDFLHRDIEGALPENEVAARERWMVETIARSTVLQCNSRFVEQQLRLHYGHIAADTRIIYNAVGLKPPRNRAAAPAAPPYFLYPANDWPHKNHENLLHAYAIYRAAVPAPWALKLTGHFADPERIATTIKRLRIDGQVDVMGHLPVARFADVFASAGALVFPSRYEGFGIPVLEAFRLGVPVVCSRAASLPEVGGDACGYFDPDDPNSIADALRRVSEDSAWRRALVAAGSRRAGAFSLPGEADKLAEVFLELAARR